MSSPYETISNYFHAKDGNRPYLMRRAFAEHATLELVVHTEAIAFPAKSIGLAAIENTVGRRFADDFENVYTFGLSLPEARHRRHFPCHWLVGMSGKRNGPIRVGCGLYDWHFTDDARCLVERAIFTIEAMVELPATEIDRIMGWVSALPYPWCTPADALQSMPTDAVLADVRRYLERALPIEQDRRSQSAVEADR